MNVDQRFDSCGNLRADYKNVGLRDTQLEGSTGLLNIFSWLTKFDNLTRLFVGNNNYELLGSLIAIYKRKIETSVVPIGSNLTALVMLKNHVNNTLIVFHLHWHHILEKNSNHDSYLNQMSSLLVLYMNMELQTLRHTKECTKVAGKLLTMLFVYLDNSVEHIFRVLLEIKFITKNYRKICDHIFTKSFTNFKKYIKCVTDMNYVKYLLLLKVWKMLKESSTERKEINELAVLMLGSRIPKMRKDLQKIFPKPPAGCDNETIWLLHPNTFDFKQVRDQYFALEETINSTPPFIDSNLLKILDSTEFKGLQFQLFTFFRLTGHTNEAKTELNQNVIYNAKDQRINGHIDNNILMKKDRTLYKKDVKHRKRKSMPKLKPGEVVVIDLTESDESCTTEKQNHKRNESKNKLAWLELTKRKQKIEKKTKPPKYRTQVEVADAHSTANSDNCSESVDLENLPISDNKVSESSEKYAGFEKIPSEVNDNNIKDNMHDCNTKDRNAYVNLSKKEVIQHNQAHCLLKLLNFIPQDVKDPKVFLLNLIKEAKRQGIISPDATPSETRPINTYNDITTHIQQLESYFSQRYLNKVGSLCKKRQDNSIVTQSTKEELPTSTNLNVMDICEKNTERASDPQNAFNCLNTHVYQTSDIFKQNVSRKCDDCTLCCKKVDNVSACCNISNSFSAIKSEGTVQKLNSDCQLDKTCVSDKNIICMLTDLDRCVDVLNRIGEHIVSVHAEKQRTKYVDNNDVCAVSTTVSGDQVAETSIDCWTQDFKLFADSKGVDKIVGLDNNIESPINSREVNNPEINKLKSIDSTSDSEKILSGNRPINTESLVQNKSDLIPARLKFEIDEKSIGEEDSLQHKYLGSKESQGKHEHDNKLKMDEKHIVASSIGEMINTNTMANVNCNMSSAGCLENNLPSKKAETIKPESIDVLDGIDILDSILNGDMLMEDDQITLDDSGSSLMSPIVYDNSNNVLNCITDFFNRSEDPSTNEKIADPYDLLSDDLSPKPLPEGSLGTTGILNSLLDFDLISMNSPSNDFLYSNIQTVNPRLIKKNCDEVLSACNEICEFESQEQKLLQQRNTTVNDFEGDLSIDSCKTTWIDSNMNAPNDLSHNLSSMGSIDLIEKRDLIRSLDSTTAELKEPISSHSHFIPGLKNCNTQGIESDFIYDNGVVTEKNMCLSTGGNYSLNNVQTVVNVPSDSVPNYHSTRKTSTVVPRNHTFTQQPGMNSLSTTEQSCNNSILSSVELSPAAITATQYNFVEHDHLQNQLSVQKQVTMENTAQVTVSENQQNLRRTKQNRILKHKIGLNTQSTLNKRKLRQNKKVNQLSTEEQKEAMILTIQPNQEELSLRYSQIMFNPYERQDTQGLSELPRSTSYRAETREGCTSRNMRKQLKCVDIQQIKSISQHKQEILLNFCENPMENVMNSNPSVAGRSFCITKNNISEDFTVPCNSTGKSNVWTRSDGRSHSNSKKDPKITSGGEFNLTRKKKLMQFSNNVVLKPSSKWSIRNVDIQTSDVVKQQLVGSNFKLRSEISPAKRRRLSTECATSILEDNIQYTTNQPEDKDSLICTTTGIRIVTTR